MESEERDSLLWRLSEEQDSKTAEPVDHAPISDETLETYRRGELDPAAAEALEQRLMTDPNCRRRLAELAGVTMPPAPAQIRQQLVERFARPAANRSSWAALGAWWRALWQPKALAFAMILTLAIGAVFWLQVQVPELPIYEISAQGLSERRGAPSAEEFTIEAYADTPVVIDATVAERAIRGVQVALYRVDGDHLGRIEDGVRQTSRPGAVRFEANASDLVGTVEATHAIFLVIGW